jgi:hypothetical protein
MLFIFLVLAPPIFFFLLIWPPHTYKAGSATVIHSKYTTLEYWKTLKCNEAIVWQHTTYSLPLFSHFQKTINFKTF